MFDVRYYQTSIGRKDRDIAYYFYATNLTGKIADITTQGVMKILITGVTFASFSGTSGTIRDVKPMVCRILN